MKLDPRASLITVEVTISKGAKSRTVRMALDTGASCVMVPWHVVEILGYAPAKARRKASITTGIGTEIAPVVILHKVEVLGKAARKVAAICHDLPPQSPVEGLLGLSFLKWFDVDLHFRRRRFTLRGPSERLRRPRDSARSDE